MWDIVWISIQVHTGQIDRTFFYFTVQRFWLQLWVFMGTWLHKKCSPTENAVGLVWIDHRLEWDMWLDICSVWSLSQVRHDSLICVYDMHTLCNMLSVLPCHLSQQAALPHFQRWLLRTGSTAWQYSDPITTTTFTVQRVAVVLLFCSSNISSWQINLYRPQSAQVHTRLEIQILVCMFGQGSNKMSLYTGGIRYR